MTNTPIPDFSFAGLTPVPRTDPATILKRIAVPFLIFSAVLFGLLTLSWLLLIPRLTQVEVGGTVRGLADMARHRDELAAQILEAEGERQDLILAVRDPQYQALKEYRENRPGLGMIRDLLLDLARKTIAQTDAIHLSALTYDAGAKTIDVTGDVRFTGNRSMTVLAEFVENLRASPAFSSVSTPLFTREEDAATGMHSPFTLTITLP